MERLTYSGTREANNAATIREIINKLCDYENAEEQGLLVRLPCKVGDDVYIIPSPSVYGLNIISGYENLNRVYHQHVGSITFADSHWYATSREEYKVYSEKVLNDIAFGITWFTDREEAEKKLKEMEKYSWDDEKDVPEDKNDHTINSQQYGWIPFRNMIGFEVEEQKR